MNVKERVMISRLISEIDKQTSYAEQIGISYTMSMPESSKSSRRTAQIEEKRGERLMYRKRG